jgi:hypothetical protein
MLLGDGLEDVILDVMQIGIEVLAQFIGCSL